MDIWTGSGYCPHCREEVMVACTASADMLHLTLTLLTGGLWILVWLHRRFCARVCLCCQCGRRLQRTRLKAATRPAGETSLAFDAVKPNGLEFNSLLVARNLVYYVPTNARYRRA